MSPRVNSARSNQRLAMSASRMQNQARLNRSGSNLSVRSYDSNTQRQSVSRPRQSSVYSATKRQQQNSSVYSNQYPRRPSARGQNLAAGQARGSAAQPKDFRISSKRSVRASNLTGKQPGAEQKGAANRLQQRQAEEKKQMEQRR